MNKYLILEFKNAGIFLGKNKFIKDKVSINGKIVDRKDMESFDEPITVHQISNMLHVLYGERPVPSLRPCNYPKVESIFETAKKSYLKIDTIKIDDKYPKELLSTQKSMHNSWMKKTDLNWYRISKYLGPELYSLFTKTLKKSLNISTDGPFIHHILTIINSENKEVKDMFKVLADNKRMALENDLRYGTTSINASYSTGIALTVTNSYTYITRLHGSIIVPVSDEDIVRLKSNKGCATFLDGGVVTIKGLKTSNMVNIDDYELVGNISTTKSIKE